MSNNKIGSAVNSVGCEASHTIEEGEKLEMSTSYDTIKKNMGKAVLYAGIAAGGIGLFLNGAGRIIDAAKNNIYNIASYGERRDVNDDGKDDFILHMQGEQPLTFFATDDGLYKTRKRLLHEQENNQFGQPLELEERLK